jgi:hypothetical protein
MILPLAGLIIGMVFGAVMAWRKGGKRLDILQWAAVNAMIFGVIGLFILLYIERNAL